MSQPRIAHYQLQSRLGQGAMGVVFRARDERLERDVAIKLLQVSLDTHEAADYAARLLQEARSAARLNHPGIITVYDCGEWRGKSYLAMELVHGFTLKALLDQRGSLKVREVQSLAKQIFAALSHAHAQDVVHRDIKPANLMLTKDGRLKITDFGIAQLPASDLTKTGTVLGSPRYMAPEQLSGGKLDGRADLYSAGVVLYQAATGQVPFDGDHPLTIAYHVLHSEPPHPCQLKADIPPWFGELIMRCLHKKPDARFADADDALAALLSGAQQAAPVKSASSIKQTQSPLADTQRSATNPTNADLIDAVLLNQAAPKALDLNESQARFFADTHAGAAIALPPASPLRGWLLQSGAMLVWLGGHAARAATVVAQQIGPAARAVWRAMQHWTPIIATGIQRGWRQSLPYWQAASATSQRGMSWCWAKFIQLSWRVQAVMVLLMLVALTWLLWPRSQRIEVSTGQQSTWVETASEQEPQATPRSDAPAPRALPKIKLTPADEAPVNAVPNNTEQVNDVTAQDEAPEQAGNAIAQGLNQIGNTVRQAAGGAYDCLRNRTSCPSAAPAQNNEHRR